MIDKQGNMFAVAFELTVSRPRLNRYRMRGSSDLDAITEYLRNVALSEALYPSLSLLEISLRNTLHRVLSEFAKNEMWFEHVLRPEQIKKFCKLYEELERKLGHSPGADKIVSELSFGFWVSLLTRPYHQKIWNLQNAMFLKNAFPSMPPMPNARREVHDRCNMIRVLRNRIMHHEPVFMGLRWNRKQIPLRELHQQMNQLLRWINPQAADALTLTDRFESVHSESGEVIRAKLVEEFFS